MIRRRLCNSVLRFSIALAIFNSAEAAEVVDYQVFIKTVFDTHPKIQEQIASMRAQEAQIESARSARLPSIKIGGQYSTLSKESSELSLSVPIYTFGRITNEIDKEGEKYRLENLELIRVSNEVIETTTKLYLDYILNSKKYQVLERTYKGLAQLLERIKRRRDSGYDSIADVNSAKSRVLQSQARAERQLIAIKNLKNEITVLFGNEISDVYPLPDTYFEIRDLEALTSLVLKQNPSILIAEQEVVIARRELQGVKLNDRPSLDLYASDDLSNPFDDDGSVGVSLNYEWKNLGRAVTAGLNAAQHRVEAKSSALLNVKQEVSISLSTLLNEFASVDEQLEQQNIIVDSLQETKKSFSRQYEAGRKSLMELLNIHNELAEAELLKIDLERQRIEYQVRLYSLGGAIYLAAITENLPSQIELISSRIE